MKNPAESYEDYVVPALFAPWAARLFEAVSLAPGDRVLDVACGTGIVARKAAPAVGPTGRVAGIDPNPAMLEVARSAATREGLAVEWREAQAESLPFADASFNIVLCQQGVQFFTDRRRGLAEMFRVLEGSGRCAVSVWQPIGQHPFFEALDSAIQAHLSSTAAQVPFSLGDADELETMVKDTGFEDVAVDQVSMQAHYPDPERLISETVNGLRAVVPALQEREKAEAALLAIRADMDAPLSEATAGNEVVLSWHANIARGTKP